MSMQLPDWINELTLDTAPMQHRRIAEAIGVDGLIKLAEAVGGTYCYLPKADYLLRLMRDKAIQDDYNGYNVKDLAIKYNLSQVQIYKIIKVQEVADGQCDFLSSQ